ncbi:efflux transporter outer membrane subunit [Neptunomonas sp.]|uniref:efflux transporter outer membrane subunit n=1 Tax=Neptunomonas sp. TaxID=1971898 RepID=UPI0035637965
MRPKIMSRGIFTVSALIVINGCAVGTDYEPPELVVQQEYVDAVNPQPFERNDTLRWWLSFDDAILNRWVAKGLDSNLDISAAVERISAAQAVLRGTGVNSVISGDLKASSTRSGGRDIATITSNDISLSGNLAIDLFGGIRREREVAQANLLAVVDDSQTARLAYLSALVSAYVNARYYQYAVVMTQQAIDSRQQTLVITKHQRAVGSATELEEEQVKALLYTAQAEIPDLNANFLAQIYAIATLLNEPAGPLLTDMEASIPAANELLGLNLETPYKTGIPADLLRNRPDVRAAEQRLRVAVAGVGVATAARLPSLTLSGSITNNNSAWSFGPIISLPIFNQGALAANQDQATSEAREAFIIYQQTVLEAVEDVQSANSAWQRDRNKVDLLRKSVSSYTRSFELSMQTYQAGIITLLDLLDIDRNLDSARLQYAAALRDLSVDWARLQIALGAGASVNSYTGETKARR